MAAIDPVRALELLTLRETSWSGGYATGLVHEAPIGEKCFLNFAVIEGRLVPVTAESEAGSFFKPFAGSSLEALLLLAQNKTRSSWGLPERHYGSPISFLLNHPRNTTLDVGDVIAYCRVRDWQGIPRIFTLNDKSTLDLLQIFQEKRIPIDLNEKAPDGSTLFTVWAGSGYNDVAKALLEIDPTVIRQVEGMADRPFAQAVLQADSKGAQFYLQAMKSQDIPLSHEEQWLKRALCNDGDFQDAEFLALDPKLKAKFYYAANSFSPELVMRLNALGMRMTPDFLDGPGFLAYNMDVVAARTAMQDYFRQLRRDGLLLTHEEFSQLDQAKLVPKSNNLSRLVGKAFVEKIARENNLKHIKVPRKVVVLPQGAHSFRIKLDGLSLWPDYYGRNELDVYAARIEHVERTLSLQEGIELMIAHEKTAYSEGYPGCIRLAEDGIYFVHTGDWMFNSEKQKFEAFASLADLLKPEDKEPFLAEYRKRKEQFDKEKPARDQKRAEFIRAVTQNPYNILVRAYQQQVFEFDVGQL